MILTWISFAHPAMIYQLPNSTDPCYAPFGKGQHTFLIDMYTGNSDPSIKGEVFWKALERIALTDGKNGLPPIDRIMIGYATDRLHSTIWAALQNLRPRELHMFLGSCKLNIRQPTHLPSRPLFLDTNPNDGVVTKMRYNLKYGSPKLFGSVRGLFIHHPAALDNFVRMCEENYGLAQQLERLALRTSASSVARQPPKDKFFATLSGCAALRDMLVLITEKDVDSDSCSQWTMCATNGSWLPRLQHFGLFFLFDARLPASQVVEVARRWHPVFVQKVICKARPHLQVMH
ncbi:hypothetical protein H0H81_001123 [Sphagnurus paluster]|uniref:Uncharacterized protein n=1 Tax=Sphagnurus paluster TaxID=117069 RepID=A0A9P7GG44_9AGAR|nr:hypothetical protein H0H81_001123 [Sphagnurus paluster]